MAKLKVEATKKPVAVKKQKTVNKAVESLYIQLITLLKKNKISKHDVADKLGMSYQGFLNSFNNRNIRLEAWYEIAEMLNKPFLARFESARNAEAIEAGTFNQESEAPLSSLSSVSGDFTTMHLKNAEEKISIMAKQIAALESQIQDKQTIIELIKR